ncbi:MAG: hypothetical protein MJA83_09830, partial [Gammaproteobacteria bacterium]|nr:hypothetical protein [Gammaproteobacteria bacterium]
VASPFGVEFSLVHSLAAKHRVVREAIAGSVGQFCVPDVSVFFWRRSRDAIRQAVQSLQPNLYLTTSPPHGIHAAGMWVKKHCPKIPWIVDFQDPYIIDPRFGPHRWSRLFAAKHSAFERSIYEQADLVLHAIPSHFRWAQRTYPEQRHKIRELMMGVSTPFAEGQINPIASPDKVFSIRVMGLQEQAQANQIFRVSTQLVSERDRLELRFIGPAVGVGEHFTNPSISCVVTGKVSHHEAMGQLAGGDVLLCVLSRRRSQVKGLSSKLFEFLSCGKPIIVINPTNPDRIFLRSLKGVRMLREPRDSELADALQWAMSDEARPPSEQTDLIRQTCSYRARVAQLVEWFEEIT